MVDDGIDEASITYLLGYHGEGGLGVQAPASIFLDSEDAPHVAYIRSYTAVDIYELALAQEVQGEWKTENVRSKNLARPKAGVSIAVDGSGSTHIAYYGEYLDNSIPFVYATSDGMEAFKLALKESLILTGLGTLIIGPITFASYRTYWRRSEARAYRESVGLYESPTLFRRRSKKR